MYELHQFSFSWLEFGLSRNPLHRQLLMHQSCQSQATRASLHQNHVCSVAVAVAFFGGAGRRLWQQSSRGGCGSSGADRMISNRFGIFCVFWHTRFLRCTMSSVKISSGFPPLFLNPKVIVLRMECYETPRTGRQNGNESLTDGRQNDMR